MEHSKSIPRRYARNEQTLEVQPPELATFQSTGPALCGNTPSQFDDRILVLVIDSGTPSAVDAKARDLSGQLEVYFGTLSALGRSVCATDDAGQNLPTGEAVGRFLGLAEQTKRDRARVLFIGNGGSAAICSHMATDWMKNGGFSAVSFNDGATLTCLSNDLGYEQVFAKQIQMHGRPGDLIVAISSSGNSVNILNGVIAGRSVGASVITLSGFSPENKLRRLGDLNFYVPNPSYGFVEISHLTICHAVLDLSMGWRAPSGNN